MINEIKAKAKEFNEKFFSGDLTLVDTTFRLSNRMSRTRGHFFYNRLTGLQEITISNILFQVNDPHQWKQTLL
ncbi:MAG: hypothetical protein PF569_00005, partial [Candidatus Woesearchaeota archaeon]|nr:hypothetical protein [Candidatus Woesearchaeota archaeon]